MIDFFTINILNTVFKLNILFFAGTEFKYMYNIYNMGKHLLAKDLLSCELRAIIISTYNSL